MARLSATEEALKARAGAGSSGDRAAACSDDAGADLRPEPAQGALRQPAPNSQPETVGTDSVDELTAAYGEQSAEAGDAAPLKQTPES